MSIYWGVCHLIYLSSQSMNLSVGISNCHFTGVYICQQLICLSSQSMNLSVGISNCHFTGGRSVNSWSAKYELRSTRLKLILLLSRSCIWKVGSDVSPGGSATWSDLSSQSMQSISRNFKLPFHWEICHLICLSSQSKHLSVGFWKCQFTGGSATWSAWALRVGIYQ